MVAGDSVVVKALCYKSKVAGSRPDEVNDFFFYSLPNPFSSTRPWGSPSP
jgi:hypothetical protein